jgi:hypothetical protein
MKLEVVGCCIFVVETERVASSKASTRLYVLKDEIIEELRNCVTDVQQHVPCSPLMDEWDSVIPLHVHPLYPRWKSTTVGI